MFKVYYIGGSPCSGKSTISEMLVEKYGFQYYKLDDYLFEHLEKGASDGNDLYKKVISMSLDETWFRNPLEQSDEEIAIYEIMFSYAMNDINNLSAETAVLAEGAGFLPNLMKKANVDKSHYACIVPTKKFQIKHYSKRAWIKDYLSSCSDKDRAFHNWMERDSIFAERVLEEAKKLEYFNIIVDGNQSINENYEVIENVFKLRPN